MLQLPGTGLWYQQDTYWCGFTKAACIGTTVACRGYCKVGSSSAPVSRQALLLFIFLLFVIGTALLLGFLYRAHPPFNTISLSLKEENHINSHVQFLQIGRRKQFGRLIFLSSFFAITFSTTGKYVPICTAKALPRSHGESFFVVC
jgi:hypothetical protein